jgi:hypothetical protein
VLITTELGNAFLPLEAAWMVKHSIEGFARGCMAAWPRWNLPPLYRSGIRFRLPPEHGSGVEHMRLPPYTLRDGWGDCDRILIYWLCEQWAHGRPASCTTYYRDNFLHVSGRRSWDDSGPEEDPSIILGAPTQ